MQVTCGSALDDPGRFLAALDLEPRLGALMGFRSLWRPRCSHCVLKIKEWRLREYSEITFGQPIKVPDRHISSSWVQPALVH